ncbi:signal peptidase II [Cohnella herbarum]|uniref:Lipoprotein signal peptidase n=1 Tax=Cohnella herbarum TaxID=2728023 RepID=A0A7Z2VN26_9BACL|nr:signal peptidase II [Cohnella herbarum]QJD86012.1 signal peptidase II [Cohnella herbarum]
MYFYLIIAAALVIDIATKIAIRMHLELGETTEILGGGFRLIHLVNTGSTGNLFHGWGRALAILVILLTGIALYMRRQGKLRGTYMQVCVALIIGGALGNAVDRIVYNHVTDFLFFSEAATMNFADIWVFTGLFLLVVRQLFLTFKPSSTQVKKM